MGLAASTDNTGLRPISFKARARTSLACARCGTHHLLRIHHTFLAWRGILFHSVTTLPTRRLVKKRDAEHRRGTTWSCVSSERPLERRVGVQLSTGVAHSPGERVSRDAVNDGHVAVVYASVVRGKDDRVGVQLSTGVAHSPGERVSRDAVNDGHVAVVYASVVRGKDDRNRFIGWIAWVFRLTCGTSLNAGW